MEELVGKRCTIIDNSFFHGDCGVIDFFDGELYHVMLDGDLDTFAFERDAIQVLDGNDDVKAVSDTYAETKTMNQECASDSFVNTAYSALTKRELIEAINRAFPDDEAMVAAVMTNEMSDGRKVQSINLSKILEI